MLGTCSVAPLCQNLHFQGHILECLPHFPSDTGTLHSIFTSHTFHLIPGPFILFSPPPPISRAMYFEASRAITQLVVTPDNLATLVAMPLHEVMPNLQVRAPYSFQATRMCSLDPANFVAVFFLSAPLGWQPQRPCLYMRSCPTCRCVHTILFRLHVCVRLILPTVWLCVSCPPPWVGNLSGHAPT